MSFWKAIEVRAEMNAMGSEFARLRPVENVVDAERDDTTWLNCHE
jgi:hypothetical protein